MKENLKEHISQYSHVFTKKPNLLQFINCEDILYESFIQGKRPVTKYCRDVRKG